MDFRWSTRAPDASMDGDTFSARWTGTVVPLEFHEQTGIANTRLFGSSPHPRKQVIPAERLSPAPPRLHLEAGAR